MAIQDKEGYLWYQGRTDDMFKAAGSKRMVSVDLHSGQIQGFFDGPVDHLTAMPVLEKYLRENAREGVVIVSPDTGRVKVAERFAQHLADMSADVAFVYKRREKNSINVSSAKEVIGDVEGRLCVLTDDMIDTAGTITSAADLLLARGAKEVWAMATHGVLSDPAIDRLKKSSISRVVLTNTIPLAEEKRIDRIEVLSVAKIIADALAAVFEETSVSELFGGENLACFKFPLPALKSLVVKRMIGDARPPTGHPRRSIRPADRRIGPRGWLRWPERSA